MKGNLTHFRAAVLLPPPPPIQTDLLADIRKHKRTRAGISCCLAKQKTPLFDQVINWLSGHLRAGTLNSLYRKHHGQTPPLDLRPAPTDHPPKMRSIQPSARMIPILFILCLLHSPCLSALENTGGVRTLRSADVHPEDYPTVQAVQFMHQSLSKQSDGKLAIRVFPSGLLGDEAPLLEQVKNGALDMNRVSAQAFDGSAPLIRVLSLPYLFRNTEHQHKVLDGPLGQEALDSLRPQGLIGLAFYDAGVRHLYSSKAPILKLEDMKNLQVRVQPSDLSMAVFEKLGAKPVKLPYSQTGNALSNGLISAAENNLPSYSSTEHYKHAPFYTFSRHTMTPEVLVISRLSWEKLSSTEQTMLRKAAQDSALMMRDMWQQREERLEASLRLAGVKFNELSKEQLARFSDAVLPIYTQFANTTQQQDFIKKIRATK